MWNDVVAARLKIMTERLQLIPHETTVCINIGLHYLVQDARASGRYDSDMRMLVRDIDQFAPRLFVWVHTTAVHPQTMDASIDENTVAKFSNLSLEKVHALNSKATAAVHKSTMLLSSCPGPYLPGVVSLLTGGLVAIPHERVRKDT